MAYDPDSQQWFPVIELGTSKSEDGTLRSFGVVIGKDGVRDGVEPPTLSKQHPVVSSPSMEGIIGVVSDSSGALHTVWYPESEDDSGLGEGLYPYAAPFLLPLYSDLVEENKP